MLINAENPSATNTNNVNTTSGCSTDPNAMVFTTDCTATGTTKDNNPIATE